jgi:hypothetical protein
MALASFLEPLEAITPAAPPAILGASPLGGAPSSSHSVGFSIQHQNWDNWCWAAVSASVAAFYGNAAWREQCVVAAAELAPCNCCGGDGPRQGAGGCNNPWFLDRALTRVGHFDRMIIGLQSYATLQAELNANRPFGCRIEWRGGTNAHFVVVGAWQIEDGEEYVVVYDPIAGRKDMTYTELCSSYANTGDSWTHSYFIR